MVRVVMVDGTYDYVKISMVKMLIAKGKVIAIA